MMLRPPTLRQIRIPPRVWTPGKCTITMARGQWDSFLEDAYAEGWILLELDENEKPTRAFQQAEAK